MAQILKLAQVNVEGISNQDISTNELVVDTLTVGGPSGTNLTSTELALLISNTHAAMSDNQNVVAGAGIAGGGSGATVNLSIGQGNGLQVDADSIQVVHSPAVKLAVTVGESITANITYAVRYALTGETASRVYKASAQVATTKKYLVAGLILSTTSLAAGDSATLLVQGLHTLGSGDALFSVGDIGKEVYLLGTGTGAFTVNPPTAVGNAQFRIGVVYSTTQIAVDLKQLNSVVPEPQYDERIQYPTGLTANTDITLPVNSRNGNNAQTYTFSEGRLEVWHNELLLFQGVDWVAGSTPTSQIKITFALTNDSEIHFRLAALANGPLSTGGGGGGSQTLQDTYNLGSTIVVASGNPLTINGPAAQKLLVINGDITVTGIIDPTAIQLTPQSSSPLTSGQAGIWVNPTGELMHDTGSTTTNFSQVISEVITGAAQTLITKSYINSTGSTIPINTPVYSPSANHIAPADSNNSGKFKVIGITTAAIANTASGLVAVTGIVPGQSATHNSYLYVGNTPGSLVDVGPSLGVYSSGFQIVRLGTIEGTNLILQIQHMGTL